jgi:hypothetical protein
LCLVCRRAQEAEQNLDGQAGRPPLGTTGSEQVRRIGYVRPLESGAEAFTRGHEPWS